MFAPKCWSNFLLKNSFFLFTKINISLMRNAENDYNDQHLWCAAPKRWLKYTTFIIIHCVTMECYTNHLEG